MITYVIQRNDWANSDIIKLVDEHVSRAADEAYSDAGVSLYDSIVLTERDQGLVQSYIDDAVDAFVQRAFDICKRGTQTTPVSPTPTLIFYVPDFDTTMEDDLKLQITRYIAFYVATAIFQQRRAALVPQYTAMTQAAMDKAITLLKSRKAPDESWS